MPDCDFRVSCTRNNSLTQSKRISCNNLYNVLLKGLEKYAKKQVSRWRQFKKSPDLHGRPYFRVAAIRHTYFLFFKRRKTCRKLLSLCFLPNCPLLFSIEFNALFYIDDDETGENVRHCNPSPEDWPSNIINIVVQITITTSIQVSFRRFVF